MYTQLVSSKFVVVYNLCVQFSRCDLTIRATPTQLLCEKPKSIQTRTQSVLETLYAITCQLYLIQSSNQVGLISISRAIVWYAQYCICTHHISFELCLIDKKKKEKR